MTFFNSLIPRNAGRRCGSLNTQSLSLLLLAGFVFFLWPSDLYSQIDFRPGFVIKTDGDTLTGFVAYRGAKRNSEACVFRASRKGEVTHYKPADIAGYGISAGSSFRAIVLPKDAPVQGTVFARVLAHGYYSLYRFRNFYVLEDNRNLVYLPPPRDETFGQPEDKIVKRSQRYIGILNYLLLDCQMNANTASYSEGDLAAVINDYNQCKGKSLMQDARPKLNVDWVVFGGYLNSVMTYHYYRIIPFQGNTVVGGIGAEFSYPRTSDRLILSVEAIFINNYYQGYDEAEFPVQVVRQDIFFQSTSIQFPIGIRYNFRNPGNTPYVRAGLAVESVLSSSIRTIEEEQYISGEVLTHEVEGGYQLKNPKGFWMAAGYNRSLSRTTQMFIEFRYGMMQGFLGSPIVDDSRNRSLVFLAGIRF